MKTSRVISAGAALLVAVVIAASLPRGGARPPAEAGPGSSLPAADDAVFEGLLYPRATVVSGGPREGDPGDATSMRQFVSEDEPADLVEHYKKVLPRAKAYSIGKVTMLSGTVFGGGSVAITISPDASGSRLCLAVTETACNRNRLSEG